MKAKNTVINQLAQDELGNVIESYRHQSKVDRRITVTPLCRPNINCSEFVNENNFDLREVFPQVEDATYWNTRAKALRLLGKVNSQALAESKSITPETILTKIIEKMSIDSSLAVRREALRSFDKLTDFSKKDDFDFVRAVKWWENPENKKAAIDKLEKAKN